MGGCVPNLMGQNWGLQMAGIICWLTYRCHSSWRNGASQPGTTGVLRTKTKENPPKMSMRCIPMHVHLTIIYCPKHREERKKCTDTAANLGRVFWKPKQITEWTGLKKRYALKKRNGIIPLIPANFHSHLQESNEWMSRCFHERTHTSLAWW